MKRLIVLSLTFVNALAFNAIDIFQAIKNNNIDDVKAALNENPENIGKIYMNPEIGEEIFPIHQAAISNSEPDILALLLHKGAHVNKRSQTGKTPLYFAHHHNKNNKKIIDLLQNFGAIGQDTDFMKCEVCADQKLIQDYILLSCNDIFCKDCLKNIIDIAIKEKNPEALKCPNPACKQMLPPEDITNIAGKDAANKIADFQARKISGMKHCPTPGCQNQFFIDDQETPFKIKCNSCKKPYCSKCFLPHNPLKDSCTQAQAAQAPIDAETLREFIRIGVKPCPKCGQNVEKIAGCDYVKCKQCRHEFCLHCYGNHHLWNCSNPEKNPYKEQLRQLESQKPQQYQPINADQYFGKQAKIDIPAAKIYNYQTPGGERPRQRPKNFF